MPRMNVYLINVMPCHFISSSVCTFIWTLLVSSYCYCRLWWHENAPHCSCCCGCPHHCNALCTETGKCGYPVGKKGRKEGLLYTVSVSLCLVWTIACKQCHVESSLCNELRTVIWFAVEGAPPDDTVLYQQMLIMVLTILYARCACKRIDWGLCSCTRTLTHLPVPVHRRTFLFVFTRSRSRGGQCH